MFRVNDLVTIVKQPETGPNSHIHMQGLSGYIEEIVGEYAQFVELNERGYGGSGAVHLSCLQLVNDNPFLIGFKRAMDEKVQKMREASDAFNQKLHDIKEKYLRKAKREFSISIMDIERIFEIAEECQKEQSAAYAEYQY